MSYLTEAVKALTYRMSLRGGFDSATLTGALTLTLKSSQIQVLDPGGAARDVTLPSVDRKDRGYWFIIYNAADASETLTVKNAAGSTVATVPRDSLGLVYVNDSYAWASAFVIDLTLSGGGQIAKTAQPTGGIVSAVIAGGAAGDHTVTGIASGDELIFVGHVAGAGSDVTDLADLTSEFSVTGANTINNDGGTSSASGKLFVLYFDRT